MGFHPKDDSPKDLESCQTVSMPPSTLFKKISPEEFLQQRLKELEAEVDVEYARIRSQPKSK